MDKKEMVELMIQERLSLYFIKKTQAGKKWERRVQMMLESRSRFIGMP